MRRKKTFETHFWGLSVLQCVVLFLQCIVVCCSVLQCVAVCVTFCVAVVVYVCICMLSFPAVIQTVWCVEEIMFETIRLGKCVAVCSHFAIHCNNTLQHTAATHCNTLHRRLEGLVRQSPLLQPTAMHCNTLQHTATEYVIPRSCVYLQLRQ